MNKKEIIQKTEEFVKKKMSGEGTGHDWWHVDRVRKNALVIAGKEKKGDKFIIELAALTHDLDDWKFQKASERTDVKKMLKSLSVDEAIIESVLEITENISFKLGKNKYVMQTWEGKIVQDADRLDAIGAIGIARVFAFGGKMGRQIHVPGKQMKTYRVLKNFKWSTNTSLHHFYEKLLLVKAHMNTKTGRTIALRRHKFMEQYLKEFFAEWKGLV